MVTPGEVFSIDIYIKAVELFRATFPNVAVDYAAALPPERQESFWEAFRARFVGPVKDGYGRETFSYETWAKVFDQVSETRRKSAGVPHSIRQEIKIALLEKELADRRRHD